MQYYTDVPKMLPSKHEKGFKNMNPNILKLLSHNVKFVAVSINVFTKNT